MTEPIGKRKEIPIAIEGVVYLRAINNLEIDKNTIFVTRIKK
jgi:hypothetical protein